MGVAYFKIKATKSVTPFDLYFQLNAYVKASVSFKLMYVIYNEKSEKSAEASCSTPLINRFRDR